MILYPGEQKPIDWIQTQDFHIWHSLVFLKGRYDESIVR